MSSEQFVAVATALTALVLAVGKVWVDVRATHELVNHKMGELLTMAQLAARKEGELRGRDFSLAESGLSPTDKPSDERQR